jgi:hypothetical protein
MQKFTKCISVSQSFNPEFTFIRLFTIQSVHYNVFVKDNANHLEVFEMHLVRNEWKIIGRQTIPNWIALLEMQLRDAIVESLISQDQA